MTVCEECGNEVGQLRRAGDKWVCEDCAEELGRKLDKDIGFNPDEEE